MDFQMDDDVVVLRYKVTDDKFAKSSNEDNYLKMKELLTKVGVYFNIADDTLVLKVRDTFDPAGVRTSTYNKITKRNAGRKPKAIARPNHAAAPNEPYYILCSDIVYMMQTMHDYEIYAYLGISEASYYRRKRKLLKSDYYTSLDKERLTDIEYLRDSGSRDYFF